MTANGFPLIVPAPYGREIQSMAFFSEAGMLPLYSGVTSNSAWLHQGEDTFPDAVSTPGATSGSSAVSTAWR